MNSLAILDGLYPNIINFMLILTRVYAVMYTFILFRKEAATHKVLVSLSVMISIYVLMLSDVKPIIEDILSLSYFYKTIIQVVIGFIAGTILNICFEISSSLGQIVSTQIGLSTASLFDPRFGMITSLTHFYGITCMIIFLMMNGHLIVIETLVHSFNVIPTDVIALSLNTFTVFRFASIIFSGSVLIAMSLIAAIMMTNICLAIMSKFAPQFNLFSVGLNMSLIIGLVIIYLTFDSVSRLLSDYINDVLNFYASYFHMVKA